MITVNRRYRFWKVFWIVLAVYIFLAIVGIIAISLTPPESNIKENHYKDIFTWRHLLKQCLGFLFSVGFYYISVNKYYSLIAQKRPKVEFVRYSVLAVIALVLYYILALYVEEGSLKERLTTGILIFSFTMMTLFNIGLALLLSYLTYLQDEKKQRKILEEQKMQLEVEKSQANFNFLKAQINPHFLHNTLNFLYSKSLPYSPELSEGILTLSDIMRYALSEGNAKDGKAPLKDEIEHVQNVIKIQQLRFSNKLKVNFSVEGVVTNETIIPFVLITLVENAFKHGDLKSTDSPIEIKVKVSGNELYFYCWNKKKNGPKELSTGIGLDNIKKRLDLAYGRNYTFFVNDSGGYYTTELTIRKL